MSVFEELIAHLKNYSDLATIQKEFKDSSGIIEELCSYTLMCSRKIIDPDPDNYIQYGPDDATVIGLLIKQHKGLEQLIQAHNSGTLDVVSALYIERRYFLFVTYLIISRYRKTQT